MNRDTLKVFFIGGAMTLFGAANAQTSDKLAAARLERQVSQVNSSADKIAKRFDRKQDHYFRKLKKQEARLLSLLGKKDSALARSLRVNLDSAYAVRPLPPGGRNVLQSVYSGRLDSLRAAFRFLDGKGAQPELLQQGKDRLKNLDKLQDQLDQAEAFKKYLADRRKLLTESLTKSGLAAKAARFQKQGFYYAEQVKALKAEIQSPDKAAKRLLDAVANSSEFKEFFERNSAVASVFGVPGIGRGGSGAGGGPQSRAAMSQLLSQRFGGSQVAIQALRGNVQSAQGQINALKQKALNLLSGQVANGNADLPKGFKPNMQKTKRFSERLQFGFNFQTQKNHFFPTTSDLGISVGYRFTDKFTAGLGSSYKLGLGQGWDKMKLSNEGIGLRSFAEFEIKGGFFGSGGYELNYRSILPAAGISVQPWQSSGLVGISKKYSLGNGRKGSTQLLWDFLSYQQVPRTQPIVFRIGYSLK